MRGKRYADPFVLAAALATACTVFDGVGVPAGADASTPSARDDTTSNGNGTSQAAADAGAAVGFAYEPVPAGCVTDVSAGHHAFTCEGLSVDVMVPAMKTGCAAAGCGLILELHGDTGSGPLFDAHLRLLERGAARGFVVVAPTGPLIGTIGNPPITPPGSTWGPALDAPLITITKTIAGVFHADAKRIHVAGFSRGGYTALRFACDQATYFASVVAGGSGNGGMLLPMPGPEATCFEGMRYPTRPIDIQLLMGRTDSRYPNLVSARDNALAHYGLVTADVKDVQAAVPDATFQRSVHDGKPVVEWIDHAYEVDPANADPYSRTARGHRVPGSTVPVTVDRYNVACKGPTAVDWGATILDFFAAHPLP